VKYVKVIEDIPQIEHDVGLLLPSKWNIVFSYILNSTDVVFEIDWSGLKYSKAHSAYSVARRHIQKKKLPLYIVIRKNRLFISKIEPAEET
jgi:hypothetical protein